MPYQISLSGPQTSPGPVFEELHTKRGLPELSHLAVQGAIVSLSPGVALMLAPPLRQRHRCRPNVDQFLANGDLVDLPFFPLRSHRPQDLTAILGKSTGSKPVYLRSEDV